MACGGTRASRYRRILARSSSGIFEVDVQGTAVTIVECRAPWRADLGPEWTRVPIARRRYSPADAARTLFWRDRNDLREAHPSPTRRLLPRPRLQDPR
jgi:hypothetical protein